MGTLRFNPINFIISMAVGWFFMSFLQTVARSLFSGDWDNFSSRVRSIAFFHDGRAASINIALIVAIGIAATGIWFLVRKG